MDLASVLILLVVMAGAALVITRLTGGPRLICTRCDGSGHVDEKWADPSKPGGWHRLEGKCPKCKGKGKV